MKSRALLILLALALTACGEGSSSQPSSEVSSSEISSSASNSATEQTSEQSSPSEQTSEQSQTTEQVTSESEGEESSDLSYESSSEQSSESSEGIPSTPDTSETSAQSQTSDEPSEEQSSSDQSSLPSSSESSIEPTEETWTLVLDEKDLSAGDRVVFAAREQNKIAGAFESKYLISEDVVFSDSKNTIVDIGNASVFTLGYTNQYWSIETDEAQKLGAVSKGTLSLKSGDTEWSISINSGDAKINQRKGDLRLQYNPSNPRFTVYDSNQKVVSIYKSSVSGTPSSSGQQSSSSSSQSSQSSSSSQPSSSNSQPASSSQGSGEYVWNVDYSEYGKSFQSTLGGLISGKTTSYSDCLSVGAKAAAYPDENSSKFIPFYHGPEASQVASTGECNREHTWPDSRGGGMIEKDPIVIRPTLKSDNSGRSNYFYGLGGKTKTEWDPASCGYEAARGESARVILYAATRYASKGLSLSNNPSDGTSKNTMGTLKTLLEWNNKYQPTDFEKTVNERYAKMGYARNPFVDCPDFANYIYDANGYRTTPYEGGTTPSSSASSSEAPSSSSSVPSSSSSSSEAPSSSSSSVTSSQSSAPTPSSSTDVSTMDWKLVTSTADLAAGDQIVFANTEANAVAGAIADTKTFMASVGDVVFSSDKSEITALPDGVSVFTVGQSGSNYTFSVEAGLLGATAVKKVAYGSGTTTWNVAISDGTATVESTSSSFGSLQYNSKDPRFTVYASEQKPIQIYKAVDRAPVYPTSIALSGSDSVQVNRSTTLSVGFTPANTNQKTITWESSNEGVATVTDGKVSGVSTGSVTITAKAQTAESTTITATKTLTVEEYVPDAYTIMIYMCGSDLESYDSEYEQYGSQASDNLAEIMQVANIPDGVNIIVETGGAKNWDPSYASKIGASVPATLTRWHVEDHKLVKEDSSLQPTDASMGASSTFQGFLEWGIANYPATKTGVIVWDHGGAMDGCCLDERFHDDILTPTELDNGLKAAFTSTGTSKLEWIGYDCCLMSVQDIADLNSDNFNYMISSQETEPGGGWDYDVWLKTLAGNPGVDTLTLGKSICDSYYTKCADYYNEIASYPQYAEYKDFNDATLAVLDLSKMSDYKTVFEAMAESLATIITSGTEWSSFVSVINIAEKYGYAEDYEEYNGGYVYDVFDVSAFLSAIKGASDYASVDVDSVIDALGELIVYNKAGKDSPNACGLCVFCAVSGANYQSCYSATQTRFSAWRALNLQYGSWYE